MRRLLAAAASSAVLLLGAGCSTDTSGDTPSAEATAGTAAPAPGPGASAGATGAPGTTGGTDAGGTTAANPGDAALAANTGAICTQATKVSGSAVSGFAVTAKDLAAQKGKNTAVQVETKARRDLEGWAFALRDLGGLTTDGALKKSLGGLSGEVVKLSEGDLYKIKNSTIEDIRKRVDTACSGK